MILAGAAAAGAALIVAGNPPADAAPARASDCFNARNVSGFRPVNRETVDLTVGANRHYRLDLLGYCPDVDWSWRIALRTRGGSSWICRGLDADLIVPSPTGVQRCPVGNIRRLTPEEYRAGRRDRR